MCLSDCKAGYDDISQTYQNFSMMTKREKQDDTLRRLEEYFKNTPKEIIDRDIAKIDAMNFPGPTAKEYFLNFNKYYFGIPNEEWNELEKGKDRA